MEDSVLLETTVVTATRIDEIAPHERTASSVSVVDKEDIADRKADLADILSNEVGVDIQRYGGMGSFSEVSIRGSSSEQVSIYVDGVPYSASGSGRIGLSSIPTGVIDKVEVYRGSAPGAFGAGAIGGVINVTTLRPDDEPGVRGSLSYGSFGTNHQTLSTNFGLGENQGVALSLGRHAADNDFEYEDNRGTPLNGDDDQTVTRENADYESINAGGSWIWEPLADHTILAALSFNEIEKGVPGLGSRPALHARLSSDILFGRMKYAYEDLLSTQLWFTSENRLFEDPEDEAGRNGRQKTNTDIDMWGVIANAEPLTGQVLTHIQMEYRYESFEAQDELAESSQTLPSVRNYFGAGLEPEIMLIPERMWLTPRVHVAYVEDELQETSVRFADETSQGTHNIDRTPTSYSLGWRYAMLPYLTVRSTLGTYTRIPEFNELFGDSGDVVGNPDLESEKSINFDAGLHWGRQLNPIEADFTYFYRKSEDLIVKRSYGDYLIAENIGKALVTGAELLLKGRTPERRFEGSASITYQVPLNKSDETAFRKKRYYDKDLPYHPRWIAVGALTYRPITRFQLTGEVRYRSESYTGPSNLEVQKLDSATVFNLSASISVNKNWTVVLDVDNLTDDRAVDRWGYPKPGRGYYATLKMDF